jgi:hypothetical protein
VLIKYLVLLFIIIVQVLKITLRYSKKKEKQSVIKVVAESNKNLEKEIFNYTRLELYYKIVLTF